MPFEDTERHLRDILESISQIEKFVGDMNFAAYQEDEKTKAAVERKLQILTEAVVRLEMEAGSISGYGLEGVPWHGQLLAAFLPSNFR